MDLEELRSRMSEECRPLAERVMDMYMAPFARAVGIEIESIEAERTVCSMTVRPDLMNSMDRCHGAALYALMDHTFAFASNMSHDGTGQSSEIKFYRPAKGRLTCTAVPINRSRSLEVYDVRVLNEEGKLVCSATCTAFLLNR